MGKNTPDVHFWRFSEEFKAITYVGKNEKSPAPRGVESARVFLPRGPGSSQLKPMSNQNTAEQDSVELEPRTRRALERVATVLHTDGTPIAAGDDPSMVAEHVAAGPKVLANDGGIVGGDGAELVDDDAPATWKGPFTETDKYGEPTGARYVRCSGCGVEVLEGETEHATHRAGCDGVDATSD